MTGEFQYFIKIAYLIMANQEYVNFAPHPIREYAAQHSSDFKCSWSWQPTEVFQGQVCKLKKFDLRKILS